MSSTINAVRRYSLVLALSVAAGCSDPVAPTPPPVPDAPTISCPAAQTVASPFGVPIAVFFDAPAVTGGKTPVTTTCSPLSGSSFPVGNSSVSCTATDALQRSASCAFGITITPPPQISAARFIAFGDSITWGEDGTYASLSVGPFQHVRLLGLEYPSDLQLQLRARYQLQAGSITVTNDGNPGESAGDPSALSRFARDVPARGFQAVLIMEGSNDVNEAVRSGVTLENAAIANLQTMIRTAKNVGLRPYLASIPPMNPNSPCIPSCRGQGAARVGAFNVRLSTLAFAEGIPFVDVNAAFGGDLSLLSTDGLHPNAPGYQRIAEAFFATLKATLDVTPATLMPTTLMPRGPMQTTPMQPPPMQTTPAPTRPGPTAQQRRY